MTAPQHGDFGRRLGAELSAGRRLCVGIDPHSDLLADWGLPDDADGARELGLRVVEAATGVAAAVKPQVAFFERHGSAGYVALEGVLAAARAAGVLVVADGKRGDIGSTIDAYAEAWFTPGSPLECDAATLTAYAGIGSLDPALRRAAAAGKGVFVLAATSNPEAAELQTAVLTDGSTVAASIVGAARAHAAAALAAGAPLGPVGVVIGATVALRDRGIEAADLAGVPILAPGYGFQGGTAAGLRDHLGDAVASTLVSSSRAVLAAGPSGIAEAIARQSGELADG